MAVGALKCAGLTQEQEGRDADDHDDGDHRDDRQNGGLLARRRLLLGPLRERAELLSVAGRVDMLVRHAQQLSVIVWCACRFWCDLWTWAD